MGNLIFAFILGVVLFIASILLWVFFDPVKITSKKDKKKNKDDIES